MKRLSPAQQRLYDEIVEAFGDGKFSAGGLGFGGSRPLFITNRRGVSLPRGIKWATWYAVVESGLVEKVGWDNIGTWYIVKGDSNVDQEA